MTNQSHRGGHISILVPILKRDMVQRREIERERLKEREGRERERERERDDRCFQYALRNAGPRFERRGWGVSVVT